MKKVINKRDLDDVGELAGLVGTFMNDYAQGATGNSRHHLFKNGVNMERTLRNALASNSDNAVEVIKDVNLPPASTPYPPAAQDTPHLPNPQGEPPPQMVKPPNEQLEFSFVDDLNKKYDSVESVITHFNKRIDDLVNSITKISTELKSMKKDVDFIKDNTKIKRVAKTTTKNNETKTAT